MPEEHIWVEDRNPIFRRGLVCCLSDAGFAICGESAKFEPAPDLARCEILVFDAGPGDIHNAVSLTRDTSVKLVALARDPVQITLDAVEAGLSGVLARDDLMPESLVACLRGVLHGSDVLPSGLLARLVETGGMARQSAALTRREFQVLRFLAEGSGTREIAVRLAYSERTVKTVVHDLMVRMGCRTRAQAVAVAARRGLI
jgi:DNA-binding NarL/FixJ family response regulator